MSEMTLDYLIELSKTRFGLCYINDTVAEIAGWRFREHNNSLLNQIIDIFWPWISPCKKFRAIILPDFINSSKEMNHLEYSLTPKQYQIYIDNIISIGNILFPIENEMNKFQKNRSIYSALPKYKAIAYIISHNE